MAQHGPFGKTGRSGGIYEKREVLWFDFCHTVFKQIRFLFNNLTAYLQKFIIGHDHGVLEVPKSFQIPYDYLLQKGYLFPEVQPLIKLLLVFYKEEFGIRILYHILYLWPGVGRIDTNRHTASALDTQVNDHPLRTIITDNGYPISLFKTHGYEGRSHMFGQCVIFVPGDVMPEAIFLFAHGHPVSMFLYRVSENLWNSFRCHA
ncbi:hypothetical protein ES703_121902 [subsurface metagenome]